MNKNVEQFPEGTRVKVTEYYGSVDGSVPEADYVKYHGREGVVLSYHDVNEPYVRIGLEYPFENWNRNMLMVPEEIEVI